MNHVLIIDDESEIRESLEEILREESYAVTTAATGSEGLTLVCDAAYDVVLLDIWLPDRDGLEVLKEIHSLEAKPEVIMGRLRLPSARPNWAPSTSWKSRFRSTGR